MIKPPRMYAIEYLFYDGTLLRISTEDKQWTIWDGHLGRLCPGFYPYSAKKARINFKTSKCTQIQVLYSSVYYPGEGHER